MNVSFDFDGCLTKPDVLEKAKHHILSGDNVIITTSRWENPNMGNNNDLLAVAKELGVNIQYTFHKPKYLFLNGWDLHYDDNPNEKEGIDKNLKNCTCTLV